MTYSNRGLTILLVEDNPGDQFLITELLEVAAINIQTLYSVETMAEATGLLHKEVIDIVLLDLSLPDSSGIGAFKTILKFADKIPVVVLSGIIEKDIALEAIALGAQDYHIKEELDEKILAKTILHSIERKRNLEEIREINERYDLVSKATNDMVWDWNLVTGEIYRSKEGWRKIFGTGSSDDDYRRVDAFKERVHPDDVVMAGKKIEQFLLSGSGTSFQVEFRVKRYDGSYGYVIDKGYLMRNAEDKVTRIIGAVRDITERKQIENAIRQSEEKYRTLIEQASDGIIIYTLDGSVIDYNPGAYIHMRYKEEEFKELKLTDLFFEEDLLEKPLRFGKLKAGFPTIDYRRLKRKDGTPLEMEISTKMLPDGNLMAIARDITQRKQVEEELKRAKEVLEETSEVAHVGGWEADIINNTVNWTTVTKSIYEVQPEFIPCINSTINFYKEGKNRDTITQLINDAVIKGTPFDAELQIATARGSERWIRSKGKAEFENGKCLRLFGTFQDIHDQKMIALREKNRSGVLELLSKDAPLAEILRTMVLGVEEYSPGIICSILLLDKDGKRLLTGAAPSLPDFYNEAINGVEIGMGIGSCGTAAFTGERVIVEDIMTHPYWENFKELAAKADLASCWSEPIRDAAGKILGSFAIYKRTLNSPTPQDIELIKQLAGLSAIVLEKFNASETLKSSEDKFRSLVHNIADIITVIDRNGTIMFESSSIKHVLGFDEDELVGKNIFELVHPDDHAYVASEFNRALATNGTVPGIVELRFLNKQGDYVYLEVEANNQSDNHAINGLIVNSRDITNRKKTEQALTESKQRLSRAEEMGNLGHGYYNIAKGEMHLSDQLYKIFGVDPENFSHSIKGLMSVIHPDDNLIQEQAVDIMFRTGEVEVEFRILRPDGDVRNVLFKTVISKNEKGEYTESFTTALDITERKKAEQLVLKERDLSDSIINSLPGIFYMYDEDRKFLRWNKNFETISGYNTEEIREMHPLDFSDTEDKERISERIKTVFKKKVPGTEVFLFTKEKSKVPLFINSIAINYEGKPCLMGIGIDISETKKTAEELRMKENAISTAISGMGMADLTGKIIYANDALGKMWGYADKEEMIGKMLTDVFEGSQVYKTIEELRTNGFENGEDIGKRKDGSFFNVAFSANIIVDEKKNPACMFGSFIDITERKIAEESLRRSIEQKQVIANLSETVSRAENPEQIYSVALKALEQTIGADRSSILLFDPDGVIRFKAWSNLSDKYIESAEGHSPWKEDAKNPQPIFIPDAEQEPSLSNLLPVIQSEGIRALGFIPLVHQNRLLGKFMVYFNTVHHFSKEEIELTQTVARHVAYAIAQKKSEMAVRQSEEKYRTLVEQAVDAIALYDAHGRVLDVNTGSANLLGYTKEELIGISLAEILTEDEVNNNPVRYDELQQGKSTVKQRKMKRKDGAVIETEVRSQQLPDGRFLSVIRDLTERIRTEEELKESYKAIRKLTRHLQNIREEERTNIAREIHDELGQQLTVLKMDVSWLNKKFVMVDEPVKQKMKDLLNLLDGTVKTVRRISAELRPSLLDDLGLIAAMEWQLNEFEKRSDIKTTFIVPEEEAELPNNVKTGLFRIFQESLTNVVRHSNAKRLLISLKREEGSFILSIQDDGIGFDKQKVADKKTLGILGMRERALMIDSTYEIISTPGKGTTVFVAVPLHELIINKQVTEQL